MDRYEEDKTTLERIAKKVKEITEHGFFEIPKRVFVDHLKLCDDEIKEHFKGGTYSHEEPLLAQLVKELRILNSKVRDDC